MQVSQPLYIIYYLILRKSDNTLLCNIELFDKLSSQFHDRLFFVKDLSGRNEICCWTFYGGGKKISEVGTDPSHSFFNCVYKSVFSLHFKVL